MRDTLQGVAVLSAERDRRWEVLLKAMRAEGCATLMVTGEPVTRAAGSLCAWENTNDES